MLPIPFRCYRAPIASKRTNSFTLRCSLIAALGLLPPHPSRALRSLSVTADCRRNHFHLAPTNAICLVYRGSINKSRLFVIHFQCLVFCVAMSFVSLLYYLLKLASWLADSTIFCIRFSYIHSCFICHYCCCCCRNIIVVFVAVFLFPFLFCCQFLFHCISILL